MECKRHNTLQAIVTLLLDDTPLQKIACQYQISQRMFVMANMAITQCNTHAIVICNFCIAIASQKIACKCPTLKIHFKFFIRIEFDKMVLNGLNYFD